MKTKILLISILSVWILFSCKKEKKQPKKEEVKKELQVKKDVKNIEIKDSRLFTINSIKAVAMNDIFIDCDKEQAESGFQKIHQHCVEKNKFDLLGNLFTKYDESKKTTILEKLEVKMDRKDTKYYLSKVIKKNFNANDKVKQIVVHLSKTKDNSTKKLEINEPIKKGDILDIHILKEDLSNLGDTKCPSNKNGNLPKRFEGRTDIKFNFCASLINCN